MATGPVFCGETTPSNFLLKSHQTSQGVLPSVAIWSFIQEPISWHFWNHIKGTAVCKDCRGAAWENNVCHCNISLILPWPFAFIPLLRHWWIGVRGVVWESLKGTLIQYSSGRLPQPNQPQHTAALPSQREEVNYTETSLMAFQVMKLKALGQLFSAWLRRTPAGTLEPNHNMVTSHHTAEMLSAVVILLASHPGWITSKYYYCLLKTH